MNEKHYYNFTGTKAGMEGIDRETINKIIHEASKDSAFYKNQQKRSAEIELRVACMKARLAEELAKGPSHAHRTLVEIDSVLESLEAARVLNETWIHIDMDMFYASVEIRDNPSLAELPVAVGGNSMISTANYVARKFGVRSAMPGFIGKKLCPQLIFVKPNFEKYATEGKKIREVLREYDPEFESMGYDEAHLCVTAVLESRGLNTDEGRQQLAEEIRKRIFDLTQLTASAGIACNRTLAKIATDVNKPNGQCYVPPSVEAIREFMQTKEVRKVPGIGKVLEKELNELGVQTCADILSKKLELFWVFSDTTFEFLVEAALGFGRTYHSEHKEPQKSTSISRTFQPLSDIQQIENKLNSFMHKLIEDLHTMDVSTKTVTVYVKTSEFETISKAESIKRPVNSFEPLFPVALRLLRSLYPLPPIRLLGLKFSSFIANKHKDNTLDQFISPKRTLTVPPNPKPATNASPLLQPRQCAVCKQLFEKSEFWLNQHEQQCAVGNASTKRKAPPPKPHKKLMGAVNILSFVKRSN